jgi:hypothetical protein
MPMTEQTEKRGSDRIAVSYHAEVQHYGNKIGEATITDLSEGGLQFHTEHDVDPESDLLIKIRAEKSGVQTLILSASVVRVRPLTEGTGYLVGCTME